MKHILFFGHRPYPNDHAVLETVFARLLPDQGWQVVWVLQPRSPAESGAVANWHDTPVYVTRRRFWRGPLRHIELFVEYLRLGQRALREHPIDIVQARTGLPEALAAWWLAKRLRRPFVFQYSFPVPLSRSLQLRRRGLPLIAVVLFRVETVLVQFLMRQSSLVLAISQNMAAILRSQGISPVEAFPLGADVCSAPERIKAFDAPADTIIYFGSTEPQRRLDFTLTVFAEVAREHPSAHLLVVGDRSTKLEVLSRQLGLDGRVSFIDRVPREAMPGYVRAARCSLSLIPPEPVYTLSSPTKVLESLAVAVPVVANREIHDQREIIQRSGGGLLVDWEQHAAAQAILSLLRQPDEAQRMGRRGWQYLAETRSYPRLTQELIRHYTRLLGTEREASPQDET